MRYEENYIGYELGNFLPPRYEGYEKADVFFLLLQNPITGNCQETFMVKVGKTRFLDFGCTTDCLKVLVYLSSNGGIFNIYDIELIEKKDGTKYFDAEKFLNELGVLYELNDTSSYRYFKSRIWESRKELILSEDETEFSIIHRRINADDYERLSTHYNHKNSIVEQGYFLLTSAFGSLMRYRSIEYFGTEKELLDYIDFEFSGTSDEIVTTFSIKELMDGVSYKHEHQQGTSQTDVTVILVHGTNLQKLFNFLDSTELKNRTGETIYLSDLIKIAKSSGAISDIIDCFNSHQDNIW